MGGRLQNSELLRAQETILSISTTFIIGNKKKLTQLTSYN